MYLFFTRNVDPGAAIGFAIRESDSGAQGHFVSNQSLWRQVPILQIYC